MSVAVQRRCGETLCFVIKMLKHKVVIGGNVLIRVKITRKRNALALASATLRVKLLYKVS